MANETRIQLSLVASKGGISCDSGPVASIHTMAGDDMGGQSQVVTTSEAPLAIPAAVTVPFYLYTKNTHATDYVEISTGTGGTFAAGVIAKIPGSNTQPLRILTLPPSATLNVKSGAGTVRIEFRACEL